MAGNGQGKDKKQKERVGADAPQRSSRVSGAASVRVEQKSNVPANKRSSRSQASTKQARGNKQASKQRPSSNRSTPPVQPQAGTGDTHFIAWLASVWNSMEPHHQQRFFSVLLLGLAILLFGALTFFRSVPILSDIRTLFLASFGWSTYFLALGLIAFAVAHFIEGILNKRFMRLSLVIGLVLLWLLVLAESRLLLGGMTGGVVATLLVYPLLGWPTAVGHVLLMGLFLIVAIVTFRITFGHVLLVGRAIGRIVSSEQKKGTASTSRGLSPFLGQRPRFSRYGNGLAGTVSPNRPEDQQEQDDEDLIDFEADFEDDDPLNDINIHKQQVGQVPREPRPAEPLDLADHQDAVQGAHQQPLPFNQVGQAAANNNIEMEPLPPNPLRSKQPKVVTRAADVSAVESPWKLPDLSILNNPEDVKLLMLGDDTATLAKTIQDTLRSFRVDAELKQEDISIGPTVIRFGIRPTGKPEMKVDEKGKQVPVRDAAGNIVYESRTRVSRIMALQNDLALVLEAKSIRMEAPVPGRPYVGVEIPNKNSRLVTLREVLESKEYQAAKVKSKLAIALGKDVAGAVRVGDLARMPHLLIAGATGAGKSVSINAIIASILTQATPDDVRMLMVDPKMVELNMYNGIPHLLSPVVTEVEKVVPLLKNGISEMERRYRLFSQLGVRNLDSYRKLRAEKLARGDNSLKNLPAIVIIIDELADLMMAAPEEVEGMICRLAQLARATGIHLVIATQRPSVDVITGLIKANIPTRISFMVSSAVDSRTIIDMGGAERLLGRGDMLYLPADAGRPERIQGAFLADDEAEKLVMYWRQQLLEHTATANKPADPTAVQIPVEPGWEISETVNDDFELDDDLLDRAEQVVREYERASISLLQRRLRIGYSRAARLIDLLEERGIIGHSEAGGRSREILDGASERRSGGEGRTMADEVADIVAEEKAREEFLKKQAASGQPPAQGNGTQNGKDEGKK